METQETAKKTTKDWRNKGLGWVPDYPDEKDYLWDNENKDLDYLRINEVTKSIEDIAKNLVEVLESLENKFISRQDSLKNIKNQLKKPGSGQFAEELAKNLRELLEIIEDEFVPKHQKIKEIKSQLKNQVFGEIEFARVKVFQESLRLGTTASEVSQLKYYLQLLSTHPNFSNFQPIESFKDDQSKYWKWLIKDEFDNTTEEIVKNFQNLVKIREDGIVGLETYTAIGKYLHNPNNPLPTKDTPLVKLLPIPIWIHPDIYPIIFRKLKSWYPGDVETGLKGLLDPKKPEDLKKLFKILKQEFYVIEPIVSVITAMISPFAIQDNLESSLNDALSVLSNENFEIDSPENSYIKEALVKVEERIKNERKDRIPKLNQTEDEKLKITFHEFILKIVEKYINKSQDLPNDKLICISKKFAPKYLFEIIKPKDNSEDSQDQNSQNDGDRDIVNTSELAVLVSRNWLENYPHEEDKKSYGLLPSFVDLSFWCSPIRDQGALNSCTAFAGVALLEYFARRTKDEFTYVSPLFLYKVARNLMNSLDDVGASVRETMKAMAAFGVPPEKYWSYEEENFDLEPPAFCYAFAQSYKTLKYFRLDRAKISKEILLFQIQAALAAGFPCIFGFTVYSSIYKEENTDKGYIPYPSKREQVAGGHTVLAVGYDNYKEIKHSDGKGNSMGALLIRNSWGTEWGQKGYGWLPYDYILKGLTADWWSLIKAEWFETGNFGLGAYAPGNNGKHQPP